MVWLHLALLHFLSLSLPSRLDFCMIRHFALQPVYNFPSRLLKSQVKRCLSFNFQTQLSSSFNQVLHDLQVPFLGSEVQGRIPGWVCHFRVGSMLQEKLIDILSLVVDG